MAALPTVRCSAQRSLGERSAIELGRRAGSGYGCRCFKPLARERGSPQTPGRSSRSRIDAPTLDDQRLRRCFDSWHPAALGRSELLHRQRGLALMGPRPHTKDAPGASNPRFQHVVKLQDCPLPAVTTLLKQHLDVFDRQRGSLLAQPLSGDPQERMQRKGVRLGGDDLSGKLLVVGRLRFAGELKVHI